MTCTHCGARAQTYLCQTCMKDLRAKLLGMPTLVAYLNDSAVGATRMSGQGSKSGYTSTVPAYDPRASACADEIAVTLGQWAWHIARSLKQTPSVNVGWRKPPSEYKHTSADYAMFLAAHSAAIAADQDAAELIKSLSQHIKRALTIINRKMPSLFCGPCPATVNDHRHCEPTCSRAPHACATRLMARAGSIEIVCPACGATHRVEKLVNTLLSRADDYRCTIPELHRVMRMLGHEITLRALYSWASPKNGKLKPAGYLRADNRRIALTKDSDDDKPVYRVSDARNLWNDSAARLKAGRPVGAKTKARKQ
jgi:hypothetical protein